MKTVRANMTIIFLLGSFVYLGFIALIPFFRIINDQNRIWEGYYMLLVSEDYPRQSVTERLGTAGFTYISDENSVVPIFDYTEMTEVPVSDLSSRFLPFDPRLDDYTSRIAGYFATSLDGQSFRIYYIESDDSPLAFALTIRRVLGKDRDLWHIADYGWTGTVLTIIVFLTAVFFFTMWTDLPKIFPAMMALPWIEFLLLSAKAGALGALILYAAMMITLEYLRPLYLTWLNGEGFRFSDIAAPAIILGLSMPASIAFSAVHSGAAYALVFTGTVFLAASALSAAYGAFLALRRRHMEHLPFLPVSILEDTHYLPGRGEGRRIMAVAALILAAALPPVLTIKGGAVPVPKPAVSPVPVDFSWEGLQTLSSWDEPGSLPDLSDYITHLAYQEGYMYNRGYLFPSPNESITVHRFQQKGNDIYCESDSVKQFTEEWYADIMADAAAGGITSLLLKQTQPSGVKACAVTQRLLVQDSVREQLFIGFLALSPFTVHSSLTRGSGQNSTNDVW